VVVVLVVGPVGAGSVVVDVVDVAAIGGSVVVVVSDARFVRARMPTATNTSATTPASPAMILR